VATHPAGEWFEEALTLRPLRAGALLAFANLTVSIAGRDWRHLELFPRAVAELLLASDAVEVDLSLSSGQWLADEWGAAPEPTPPGLTVSAWFPPRGASQSWATLLDGLGTLVCARAGSSAAAGSHASGHGDADGGRRWLHGHHSDRHGRIHGSDRLPHALDDRQLQPPHDVAAVATSPAYGGGSGPPPPDPHRQLQSALPALRSVAAKAAKPPAMLAPLPPLERRHVAAPRERVCTENLGSWLGLTPCGTAEGIGSLLGGTHKGGLGRAIVRDARHTSLRVRVATLCASKVSTDGRCRPRTQLTLSLRVLLPADGAGEGADERAGEGAGEGAIKGQADVRRDGWADGRGDRWASALLDGGGLRGCALARRSTLSVLLSAASATAHESTKAALVGSACTPARIWPAMFGAEGAEGLSEGMLHAEWDLPPAPHAPLVLGSGTWWRPMRSEPPTRSAAFATAPVAQRRVGGSRDRSGTLLLEIRSNASVPLRVEVLDELPRWVLLRWSSLRAWVDGAPVPLTSALSRYELHPHPPSHARWPSILVGPSATSAGADGQADDVGSWLLWTAMLPAGPTSLVVAIDFDKPVLNIDLIPADGSRGLDVGAATVAYCYEEAWPSASPASCTSSGARAWPLVHTNAVVIPVPIADDSMLFNVIAITSTLLALFVGSMFGLTAARR